MRSPNFNQAHRGEAISLSKEPSLDEIVNHVLENLGDLPTESSKEALDLLDKLKPIFYAAIAQVIERVIDFDSPPLDKADIRVTDIINKYQIKREPAEVLGAYLRVNFYSQLNQYLEENIESTEVITLQKLIDLNRRLGSPAWDSVGLALNGGLDTMLWQVEICFRSYYELANSDARDLDEVLITMKKSSSDLINATLLNTLQLLAISKYFQIGGTPPNAEYDKTKNLYKFTSPLDQIQMTDDLKNKLVEEMIFHNQTNSISAIESAEKVGDLKQITQTIGCPVNFRPQQVHKLWWQAVDQAEVLGLL